MMFRKSSRAGLFLLLVFQLFAGGARAGMGEHAGAMIPSSLALSPVERIQYYSLDGENYCWYDDGWNGPGWYWCGDDWVSGFGWGGPYGWNGWGGGYWIRRPYPHGIGAWHPGVPPGVAGAPHGVVGAPPPSGLGVNRPSALPGYHGGAPAFNGFGAGGFRAFGGGGGFHAFGGGGGGFHGGGAFMGGHGGGHR